MAIMSCEFDEYLTMLSMVISSKPAREIIANDRENRHNLLNFHTAITQQTCSIELNPTIMALPLVLL